LLASPTLRPAALTTVLPPTSITVSKAEAARNGWRAAASVASADADGSEADADGGAADADAGAAGDPVATGDAQPAASSSKRMAPPKRSHPRVARV
jgi:hypothetical protein